MELRIVSASEVMRDTVVTFDVGCRRDLRFRLGLFLLSLVARLWGCKIMTSNEPECGRLPEISLPT